MSLHIRKSRLRRAAPYVSLALGVTGMIAGAHYAFADRTEGPVHDRRREIALVLNHRTTPREVLETPGRLEGLKAMKREYDEIMANSKVREDLEAQKKEKPYGILGFILGAAVAFCGAGTVIVNNVEKLADNMEEERGPAERYTAG